MTAVCGPTSTVLSLPGAGGMALSGEAFGAGDGPRVLMSHGGGQCRQVWGDTARLLAAAGYRPLTLDLRGHGASARAVPPRYEPTDFARDFAAAAAWVEDLDGRAPHFVGASLSGVASMIAAGLLRRDAFASLTVVDVAPHVNAASLERVKSLLVQGVEAGFATAAEAARAVGFPPGSPILDHVAALGSDGRWRWRWDGALIPSIHHDTRTRRLCERGARGLRIPVHLIRARRSDFVSDEAIEDFRARTPQLRVTTLPDARHVVTGDPDGVYARAILGFYRDLPDAP